MGDLTKWEIKSAKINFIVPVVGVVAVFLIIGVAAILKPKAPESKKKDPNEAALVDPTAEEEEVDWENF
jgi:NADH:ubiquinone oxidoreductase subunit 3 (subunit A)